MRSRGWLLLGVAGVLAAATLSPAGGEPGGLVGGPGPPVAVVALAGGSRAMGAPVAVRDGFLLAGVSGSLAKCIAAAQNVRGQAFTIAIDGGQEEALAVSPDRLRDFRNVYYRVIGKAGAWRLEERGFSPTAADDESKLIRRGLGVPEGKRFFFLPGRHHLLVPAKASVVLSVGGERWDSRVQVVPGAEPTARRAVVLAAGQAISLALGEALSTASAWVGAPVTLAISEDVVTEGLVAISKGTPVEARVADVTRPDAVGNPGTLVLELGVTKAVDGSDVPLAGRSGRRLAFEGCPGAGCFTRARHLELPSGTKIAARAGSKVAVLAPVPEEPVAAAAAPGTDRVTQAP